MKKAFQILLLTFFFISINPLQAAQNDLAICMIFKDVSPYLKEWIEFHKLQGVKHFYLYNNNSTDDYSSILQPYIEQKEVTLTQWSRDFNQGKHLTWKRIQCDAYNDCLDRFGPDCEWIAFIDSDEFLFCPTGELLPDFLKRYESYGGVCVNWQMFGTSHVEDIPQGFLMIELLTRCAELNYYENFYIKSIVQPKFVTTCVSAHFFTYRHKKHQVCASEERCFKAISSKVSVDQIRINHYWTRTESYFREHKIGIYQKRGNKSLKVLLEEYELTNQCEDFAIQQFVPKLKQVIFENSL